MLIQDEHIIQAAGYFRWHPEDVVKRQIGQVFYALIAVPFQRKIRGVGFVIFRDDNTFADSQVVGVMMFQPVVGII